MPEFPLTIETLLLDESFINHCLNKDAGATAYWKAYALSHPEQGEILELAAQCVTAMHTWGQSTEIEEQWDKLQEMISEKRDMAVVASAAASRGLKQLRRIAWTGSVAAGVTGMAMVIGIHIHKAKRPASISYVTISAQGGHVREFGLPDGSVVWLDAGSTIRYREDSAGSRKIVLMEGQIFCKVKHDSAHRFSVQTPAGLDVNDIGTAFTVQSYAGLHEEVIRVLEGEVTVQQADSNVQVLKKDQGIELDGLTEAMTRITGVFASDTSWISGRIELNDVTFGEMAIVLNKTFGLHISFENPDLMKYRASTSFRRTDPQRDVLEALKLVYGITYTMNGSSVVLHGIPEHH